MVEQSGEPFLLPFLCCLSHTAQSLGHAFPALCRAHVWIERCSPWSAPFPPQPPPKVALLCSAGSQVLRRSPTSPERACPPFGLWPSRTGLALFDQDVQEISRFSCMLFLSVRGFLDYAGPTSHSRSNAAAVLPSSTRNRSRHPDPSAFRSSIARPTDTSVYAST